MEYLYIAGAVAILAWAIQIDAQKQRDARKRKEQFLEHLATVPNYKPSAVHEYNWLYFGVDTENDVVCYATPPTWMPLLINARDILSVTVHEDGQTVTHASRPKKSRGAILGNLVVGNVAVLIPGPSTRSSSVEYVNKITLRLELDNVDSPIIDVPFMISRSRRSDPHYKKASSSARSFSSLVTALMKRGSEPLGPPSPLLERDAILEGLTALAALRADGVLSDDEFQREKSRIIGTYS